MRLQTTLILLVALVMLAGTAFSQQLPSDLSAVRASQLSDAQLQRLYSQAMANGLSQTEIESELTRRGLPGSELEEIKQRVQALGLSGDQNTSSSADTVMQRPQSAQRKVNQSSRIPADFRTRKKRTSVIWR